MVGITNISEDSSLLDCYVEDNGRHYQYFGRVRAYEPEGGNTYPAKFWISVFYTT